MIKQVNYPRIAGHFKATMSLIQIKLDVVTTYKDVVNNEMYLELLEARVKEIQKLLTETDKSVEELLNV